ncbi:hypothetical protein C8Q74DRAFT_961563 [Fomes fomentarius]|nr:hypothetical protein C8Q74DRAFT_961563 [Fomes fomentarius]
MCSILLTLLYAAVTDDVHSDFTRNMEGTRIAFGLNRCQQTGAVCFRSLARTLSRTITKRTCISTASDCPRMIDHAHWSHGPEQAISFSSVHMDVRSQDGHSTVSVLHPTITRLVGQVRCCPRNRV